MRCPCCNNDMELGIIRGGRDSIKWIPKNKDKGMLLAPFVKGVIILDWLDSKVEGYYCSECSKITIDIPK